MICSFKIALTNTGNKLGYVHLDGAALNTRHIFTFEAACCLSQSVVLAITDGNLAKRLYSFLGFYGGHRIFLQTHICHLLHLLEKIAGVFTVFFLKGVIHRGAAHSLVEIDKIAVEIGSVNTGKFNLAAHS